MKLKISRVLTLSVLAVGFNFLSFGQSTNATLSGTVQDPQGALIPRASVVATQIDTAQSRQTTSGDDGHYTIPNLPIGAYRVTVSSPGFKTIVIPSITLQVNQSAELNLKLQVGSATEEVTVTTQAPLLNTETSSVGQVVQNSSIESQPLNGREFWQLVALVPGASYTPGGEGIDYRGQFASRVGRQCPDRWNGIYLEWMADGWSGYHRIRAGRHQYSAERGCACRSSRCSRPTCRRSMVILPTWSAST